jgi:hypothetical protein
VDPKVSSIRSEEFGQLGGPNLGVLRVLGGSFPTGMLGGLSVLATGTLTNARLSAGSTW